MKEQRIGRRTFLTAAGGAGAMAATPGAVAEQRMMRVSNHPSAMCEDLDVLVVGGGPSGIGASLASSRMGAKTLLIENHAFFGGIGAFSLGMPLYQMRPGGKPRSDLHELLIQKLQHYGEPALLIGRHMVTCNVDYLKVAVLDALDEVGCNYLVHTQAVDTVVEGNRVVGVVVGTKEGLRTIRAQVVVDCTGDADVSYFAGAETMKALGELAPMTLQLVIGAVDMTEARKLNTLALAKQARAKYPLIPSFWELSRNPSNVSFYINHAGTRDLGQFDGTNPEELTRAETLSRRQVVQMAEAMREYGGEAMQNIELMQTAPQIGVRESRRVKGEYVITYEDAKEGRTFDDVIACRGGRLDIGFVRNEKIKIHDVPYRAILPEKVDGLLVAGRCISTSHLAAAAAKDMGNCLATGHAAGVAAALCAKKNLLPRALNVKEVQDVLRADHVDLDRGGQDQTVGPGVLQRSSRST